MRFPLHQAQPGPAVTGVGSDEDDDSSSPTAASGPAVTESAVLSDMTRQLNRPPFATSSSINEAAHEE